MPDATDRYWVATLEEARLVLSIICTPVARLLIGASPAMVTIDRWWTSGTEMLLLGLAVAAAYWRGALVANGIWG